MNQKVIISSLALDLKRIALGLYRGSSATVSIFKAEALKRGGELENSNPNKYLINLWSKTKRTLEKNDEKAAEDTLMYSTLFQNFAVKKMT